MSDRTPRAPTKERIVDAARQELARHGYDGMTLRGVARRAQVDTRLVSHYFAGKDRLCAEAVRLPCGTAVSGPPDVGEPGMPAGPRIAQALLRSWTADPPVGRALVAAALTHERSGALLRSFLTGLVDELLGPAQPRHREPRVAMTVSHLLGLALLSCAGAELLDPPAPLVPGALGDYLLVLLREPLP
ncbi:TetR/AcrR family transcriptional regulator [Streptomyces sp. NPDC005863]|uniref:TetR/AcrR family transcriptional regulator n=1 Tax=unclassified Streptomyces TaxID=2593676 RepID=UPI003402EABF